MYYLKDLPTTPDDPSEYTECVNCNREYHMEIENELNKETCVDCLYYEGDIDLDMYLALTLENMNLWKSKLDK